MIVNDTNTELHCVRYIALRFAALCSATYLCLAVHSLDLVVFICVYFVFFFRTAYMLCYCQHSGVDLVGLKPGP